MDAATAQQRTMKDFLELYNKMVYHCFDKCVSNFNNANTSAEEMDCVNVCTDKGINFNQRHMMVFVEHQNAKQKLAAKAAEEAAAVKTSQSEDAAASPLQRPDASGLPSMAGDVEPGSVAQASGSSPLLGAQQDTSATGPVPQTVCWRGDRNLPHTAFSPISSSSDNYVGQSVIDQYLLSRPGMLKYV